VACGRPGRKFNPMNTAGTTDLGGFTVDTVRADHSPAIRDEMAVYLGNPCGAIIKRRASPPSTTMAIPIFLPGHGLIAEIHQPQVALVRSATAFTMSPAPRARGQAHLQADKVSPATTARSDHPSPTQDKFVAEMKGHATAVVGAGEGQGIHLTDVH